MQILQITIIYEFSFYSFRIRDGFNLWNFPVICCRFSVEPFHNFKLLADAVISFFNIFHPSAPVSVVFNSYLENGLKRS